MNRRDFFNSRRLATGLGQAAGAAGELADLAAQIVESTASPPADYALTRLGRRAMATQFEIFFPFGYPDALAAGEEAFDLIDDLETQLSVYRPESELSEINRRAAGEAVAVEERLFALLALAGALHRDTGGAFDVAVGPLVKAWGFYRRQGRLPTDEERALALESSGWRHVRLDAAARSVRFDREGVELNLGSIGKGHALDRAARLLRERWKVPAALLHGGRSSVYASGSEPGGTRGWRVGVAHPDAGGRTLAVLRLRDRALGTSAATFQSLEHGGRRLGHILDPRTGWPAAGVASASAVAPTAAEADALATAFYVLGAERTRAYCAAHPRVAALLLPDDEVGINGRPLAFGFPPGDVEFS